MSDHSNYPDDIRMYDNDPRSPFYSEADACECCDTELEVETDCDDHGNTFSNESCPNSECEKFEVNV